MGEWKEVSFLSVLDEIIDNRGKTCPTQADGTPLIATNCVKNTSLYPVFEKVRYVSEETMLKWFRGHPIPGDLIFVTKGSPGRVCVTPDPVNFCIAQDMVAIRPDEQKVYPRYLLAILRSNSIQRQIESLHVGSLIPHFKKGDFGELRIPIPDREFQLLIGDFYFHCSQKIDLLHRQNTTLEQMGEALFRQWFVEEAEEDWEWGKLEQFVEVHRGLSYKGSGLAEEGKGVPMHNLNSIYEGGGYKYEGIKYYDGPYKDRHIVHAGDVVVTNTEQGHEHLLIGYPAIVPAHFGDSGIFSQHLYRLEIKKRLTSPFLYHLLKTHDVHEQIAGASNGSTVNMLPKDGIEWVRFRVPPRDTINRFTTFATDMIEKQHKIVDQVRTLEQLRDTLLPKLMSGEIRIG